MDALLDEMRHSPDLLADALAGRPTDDPFPLAARLVKPLRESPAYAAFIEGKMKLGSSTMMELGNLYSGALPCWIAAGLEEAADRSLALEDQEWLLIGYGSGDTSEVLPAKVVPGWETAARKIGLRRSLDGASDLSRDQYEALHDGRPAAGLAQNTGCGYRVDRIGALDSPKFQDFGIEYYRYVD